MIRFLTTTIIVTLFSGAMSAQTYFFSLVNMSHSVNEVDSIEARDSTLLTKEDKPICNKSFFSNLSLSELEFLNSKFLGKGISSKTQKNAHQCGKRPKGPILCMYKGTVHPLTISNVLKVMDEENISNQLFVLAQSLLETGYYRSNACKNYNNLFGLTNPRSGKLYHFDCWESSVVAYREFVQYKYKGGSYLSFLKRIGYAEDPRYISKVIRISRKINHEMAKIID